MERGKTPATGNESVVPCEVADVPVSADMDQKKRPYTPPRLIVYGNVRTITQEGGPNRNKDSGNNALGNRT